MYDIDKIMRLTPVELMALSKGYDTRQVSDMSKLAEQAMMIRYAVLGKNPKRDKMVNEKRSLAKLAESYGRLYPELDDPDHGPRVSAQISDSEKNKKLAEMILMDARRAKQQKQQGHA